MTVEIFKRRKKPTIDADPVVCISTNRSIQLEKVAPNVFLTLTEVNNDTTSAL